ncbi:MAG: hypothetical protein JJ992_16675, partial [Planctomycetes bacterium]|nr:hypothetical protein [Planctomycetota bacterium]
HTVHSNLVADSVGRCPAGFPLDATSSFREGAARDLAYRSQRPRPTSSRPGAAANWSDHPTIATGIRKSATMRTAIPGRPPTVATWPRNGVEADGEACSKVRPRSPHRRNCGHVGIRQGKPKARDYHDAIVLPMAARRGSIGTTLPEPLASTSLNGEPSVSSYADEPHPSMLFVGDVEMPTLLHGTPNYPTIATRIKKSTDGLGEVAARRRRSRWRRRSVAIVTDPAPCPRRDAEAD